jgi:hypothetical protein
VEGLAFAAAGGDARGGSYGSGAETNVEDLDSDGDSSGMDEP